MSFLNNLNNTYELLKKLDYIIMKDNNSSLLKDYLLSVSDDLARYKDIDAKNIKFQNDEIKSKIADVLNRINEIELHVKNKLIITQKYNSYLNS